MTELREDWKIKGENYNELSKSEFESLLEKKKTTIEEVRQWSSNIDSFKITGGLKNRGWTDHDIDFYFDLPENGPWNCPCRDLLRELPEPNFGLPIKGRCEGCGASISWKPDEKRWYWLWDSTRYRMVKKESLGVTLEKFKEVKKRVNKLEEEKQNLEKRIRRLEKISKDSPEAHDFFNILNLPSKEVDEVRIKNIQVREDKRALVTLEAEGKEYQFLGDVFELVNPKELLRHWKETVIPSRMAIEDMSEEELEERMKKLEGTKV